MVLISHEIPKQLFPLHDLINDYPYCLAHLLMEETEYYDGEYAEFYKSKLRNNKFSIMDNSCYELEYPIDNHLLYQLGEEYSPSHIVIPDIYKDCYKTIDAVKKYTEKYGRISTPKFFAVVQGETMEEYNTCYNYYIANPYIDIIGVNFKMDRNEFLLRIFESRQNSFPKKIHLLGCENVTEFFDMDQKIKDNVYSVDTSAPIIHGWNGNQFQIDGCFDQKPPEKLAECLNIPLDQNQLEIIYSNIKQFRQYFK